MVEQSAGVVEGAIDGSFVVGDADENREVEGFLIDDTLQELVALRIAGVLEEVEHWKSELSFFEIGAECFSKLFLGADEVEAVVVDLVSGAELHAELPEGSAHVIGHAGEIGREVGGCGEERAGLHFDDVEVIGLGEGEVEATLCLQDFSLANFARGFGDFAREGEVIELGGKHQGMREERVAEEDGGAFTPLCVGGRDLSAGGGAIDDVIVDEGGHVDELEDGAEQQVVFSHAAGSATDEGGEGRADAFTGGVADVRDVWLDARVEGADLVAEGGFDLPEFVLDHQEWKADFIVAGDLGLGIHADWGGLVKLFTRCGDSQPILPVNSGFLGLFWDCCRK